MKTGSKPATAERLRFLRRLSAPDARLVCVPANDATGSAAAGQPVWQIVRTGGQNSVPIPDALVREALSAGVAEAAGAGKIRISQAGRLALKRALCDGDAAADQHRILTQRASVATQAGDPSAAACPSAEAALIVRNHAESPLARLAARKTKNGRPLLNREEFSAGERLRADYSFAAMMPSIGQGWRTERTAAGRGGGIAELSDDVMAARQRVERVLGSLEPVLAGVLVDVCCHLKGLETVEAERGWPARCAKIVLQIGLSALADRYGERTQAAPGNGLIRSWSN